MSVSPATRYFSKVIRIKSSIYGSHGTATPFTHDRDSISNRQVSVSVGLLTLAWLMTEGEARFPGGTPLFRALVIRINKLLNENRFIRSKRSWVTGSPTLGCVFRTKGDMFLCLIGPSL